MRNSHQNGSGHDDGNGSGSDGEGSGSDTEEGREVSLSVESQVKKRASAKEQDATQKNPPPLLFKGVGTYGSRALKKTDRLTEKVNDPFPLRAEERAHARHWEQTRLEKLQVLEKHTNTIDVLQEKLQGKVDLDKFFDRSKNSLVKNMTPDDLAGVMKEARGVHIFNVTGSKTYNHFKEARQALSSIDNFESQASRILSNPTRYGLSSADVSSLRNIQAELSSAKNQYQTTLEHIANSHKAEGIFNPTHGKDAFESILKGPR